MHLNTHTTICFFLFNYQPSYGECWLFFPSLTQTTFFCSDLIKKHINHLEGRGTRSTRMVRSPTFCSTPKSPVLIHKYTIKSSQHQAFRMWSTAGGCGKPLLAHENDTEEDTYGLDLCMCLLVKKHLMLRWWLRQSCFWLCLFLEMSKKNDEKNRKLEWMWLQCNFGSSV